MRVLTIGDIHGCSRALDLLVEAIGPRPDDLVITLGDYVDRGPDSRGAIERLIELGKRQRLIALRGNHDQMMLNARRQGRESIGWLMCGGLNTLASYAGKEKNEDLTHVPEAHWEFLEASSRSYETDTHFFVHANAYPDLPLREQPDSMLLWERLEKPHPHSSGKIMVCGHTAQKSGVPLNLGHTICIDTWAYGEGWLTCLDVTSGEVWQASERGEVRRARIEDYAPVP